MPIPKGINNPAVRGPWLAARREKLAEFDRLVGKGYSQTKAARAVGMNRPAVLAMRSSVERWQERGEQPHGTKRARIDLGLALLSVVRLPGERLTQEDIAAWCDCPTQTIQRIEHRALQKMRLRLLEAGHKADLFEQVLDFPAMPRLRHAA